VKLVRIDDESKEHKESQPERKVKTRGGGSYYCPYRAWSLTRGMIQDPAEHVHCGKKKCWGRFNSSLFKGKEPKV
jgi:hypothetical protein